MRILVLRGGAIGDFLVTLPMLGLLRTRWPDAGIELVGNARAGELGVRGGYLNAVHSQHESRWSALFGGDPLPGGLGRWLAAFDLVISFWPDPDGALARRFPMHPGQHFLSAGAAPVHAPAARHFCEAVRPLGLSTTDFRSRLPAPGAPADGPPAGHARRPVAVHPGSGSDRKNWPVDRWRTFIARIEDPVLIVLGEAERKWLDCESWLRSNGMSGRAVEVSRNLALPGLAAALGGCRLFVGHDSGLSHLAAAVGTPCVLLFGPTDPALWAPPGDHVRVIRRGADLESIPVDAVLAMVQA